jgi:preprotein translocase subunit YajC
MTAFFAALSRGTRGKFFMSFFIQDALAQAAPAPTGTDSMLSMLPLLLVFVVFYFFLIRPQAKRQKEHKTMVSALAVGDEVVTAGGVLGKVSTLGEQFVEVEIADGVRIKVQRHTIGAVMPKGTLKSV